VSRSSDPGSPRLRREARTLELMVGMYCRAHHEGSRGMPSEATGRPAAVDRSSSRAEAGDGGLCAECADLLDYALRRLDRCPYGAAKPTCAKCPTHCYRPDERERVRAVMRYSGPRMLRSHPYLALTHLADGRRSAPD